MKFMFSASSLPETELRECGDAINSVRDLEVSATVREAAERRVLEMARDLAFTTRRDEIDAMWHVIRQNPTLARLSRARIAPSFRDAHVTVRGA